LQPGSKSKATAEEQGLKVVTPSEAAEWADVIMILTPDPAQRHLYTNDIEKHLTRAKHLLFGHGFSVRYGYIKPPADVDVSW
jgi:ketol-acid reductoisomerase